MVFSRSLRADIKRSLTNLFSVITIIMVVTFFAFNAVFSASSTSIPVEILWINDDATMRPAQVFLELRKSGDNTVLQTATLTDANADPNDANRWYYTFTGVSADVDDIFVVSQQGFSGYQITSSDQSTYSSNPGVASTSELSPVSGSVSNHKLDGVYEYLFFGTNDGSYYLWTNDDYSSNYSSLAELIIHSLALPISISDIEYFYGTHQVNNGNIFVRYNTGNATRITIRVNGLSTGTIYAGDVSPIAASKITLTNTATAVATHTLTVHHINEDNTQFAPDVITTYNDGDTYTANPIADDHYDATLQSGQATGIITGDIELTYVYHPRYHNVIYQFTGDVIPPNAGTLLPATAEHLHGSTVTVAPEPTAEGYRFLGWKMDGVDAGTDFMMPTEDVIITGSWEQFNGYFTPEITMQVINEQEYYRALDTVAFEITVTNTADFPISNVTINDLLDGAMFTSGTGYTVVTDQQASIATIAAGASVTLYASYTIPKDITQTIINTVEIASATADNYYYLDQSQDYSATADFYVRSTQDDPVLTGVNSNGTILYSILMLIGAVGIGASIVIKNSKTKLKEREK